LVLAHELANFPCDRAQDFLSLGLFRLSGAIRKLLFDNTVWWFKPAQSQLRYKIIHHSFICAIFVSKPAPNSNDPVFVQLGNIELGEAPATDQVVLRLFQARMLEECFDNRLGIFARIISHLVHPLGEPSINPVCRISRFFVALPPVRDLLPCAKHLFVAAKNCEA
jgi:hypothetical protein